VTVLQKKVCMLGAVGVGKTSLVRRFVESIFTERYQATVGVKIDRRTVTVGDTTLNLMLWDLQGEAEHQRLRMEYLRGAAGYLLVADLTQPASLDTALDLGRRAAEVAPGSSGILVVNKIDLAGEGGIDQTALERLGREGWQVVRASARTGQGVEAAFRGLAEQLVNRAATAAEDP
jgi:small GTP-binding protein